MKNPIEIANEMDMTAISEKAQSEYGLNKDQASLGETLYRQFMALKAMYPSEKISPPKLADYFWHEHLTHTRKYMDDCKKLAGDFIHHNPLKEEDESAWENAKKLYKKEFNVDINSMSFEKGMVAAMCH